MRTIKEFIAAIILLGLFTNGVVTAQTYQITIPATGNMDLTVEDYLNGGPDAPQTDYFIRAAANFGSLTETVIYDPIHQTLRQVGYITSTNGVLTGSMLEDRIIQGAVVYGDVVVSQQISNNIIPFDSGVVGLITNGLGVNYYSDFHTIFHVNATYTLTTGEQSYTNDFPMEFTPNQEVGYPLYSVATNADASTLTLDGSGVLAFLAQMAVSTDFTASNGFRVELYSGEDGDRQQQFLLHMPHPVIAQRIASNDQPAPFFAGQSAFGSNSYYLQFTNSTAFGYYSTQDFPYVFHYDMGWFYFIDGNDAQSGGYLYDYGSGHFWYTSPQLFPYLYDFSLNSWIYYYSDPANPTHYSTSPRYFYNFNSSSVITF